MRRHNIQQYLVSILKRVFFKRVFFVYEPPQMSTRWQRFITNFHFALT